MLLINFRKFFRLLFPPILFAFSQNRNIYGNFKSYKNALLSSGGTGYAAGSSDLIEYVKSLRNKSDSKNIWAWTTLSAILNCIALQSNRVDYITNIYDYGGGYGETFFQFQNILSHLNFRWVVVELEDKVNIAKREGFECSKLFFITVSEFDSYESPQIDCLLLGGVLQYFENPYQILENLINKDPMIIALDRTPVLYNSKLQDYFFIQEAPLFLGGSVHPLRILNLPRIEKIIEDSGYKNYGEHDYGSFPRSYSDSRYVAQIWKKS